MSEKDKEWCYKILIMEKGNLAESGNHEELMNKKGVYYALYRQQE